MGCGVELSFITFPLKKLKGLPSRFQHFRMVILPVRGMFMLGTKRFLSLLFYGFSHPLLLCSFN